MSPEARDLLGIERELFIRLWWLWPVSAWFVLALYSLYR